MSTGKADNSGNSGNDGVGGGSDGGPSSSPTGSNRRPPWSSAWSVPLIVGVLVAVVPVSPNGEFLARMLFGGVSALAVAYGRLGVGRLGEPRRVGEMSLLLLLSLGGVYACAPETDQLRRLAVGIGLLVFAEFLVDDEQRRALLAVGVAFVGVAAFSGAIYRDTAVVGSLASIGLIPVAGLSRFLPGPPRLAIPQGLRPAARLALHAAGCLAMGRLAGLASTVVVSIGMALLIAAVVIVVHRCIEGPMQVASDPSYGSAHSIRTDGPR